MGLIYIAGSAPGAGATTVASALAAIWRAEGHKVALVKPLSPAGDGDPSFYGRVGGSPATVTLEEELSRDALDAAVGIVGTIGQSVDVVIVEGLPLTDRAGRQTAYSQEFAKRLGSQVLAVVPYDRLTGAQTATTWTDAYGSLLIGCVLNKRTRYMEEDTRNRLIPELSHSGLSAFGAIPEDRLLLAPTVQQVVDHLGGTYYAGLGGGNELVEHFLIGGLITEWGGNYFGRFSNQVAIVRGGRIDIQMAALNFPLNALVLTACDAPSQYVQQRAEDLDVPLVTVSRDTHDVALELETLELVVGAHHASKAERSAEIVAANVDMSAVSAAAGVA